MATTTKRTTVVTEVPDERRWQGRDWVKALVAGGLALSLLRPGATTAPVAQPTAVAVASPIPAVVATVVPTAAPAATAAPIGLPGAEAPAILSTREAVLAGPYEVRGTGSPGSLVEVLINGVSAGTATVDGEGRWVLPTNLEAGPAEILARAVNESGAEIIAGEPVSLSVGEAAEGPIGLPGAEAPAILSTREAVLAGPYEVRGTGSPGSLVEVLVNGASAGTATVDADGRWSLPTTLEAGPAEILARAVNESGAEIIAGEPVSLSVGEAPLGGAGAAPTFDAPAGDLPVGPAVLTGTGEPGTTVRVSVGGVEAGTAVVGPDGTWQLEATLAEGRQSVVVEALDAGGAVVAAADPVEVGVAAGAGGDGVAGGAGVTLAEPVEGAELQPGPVTVGGVGRAGSVLEILDGDRVLGEVTVGPDGTWSTEVPLEAGTSAISVRERGTDQVLVRPVRVTVGAAPVAGAGCGDELAAGCQAWVTRAGGLQLRMRSAPTIAADNIVARLPIGTEMTLEEGPQSADGFTWWRVTTEGGNTGWVSGENLVTQPD